MKLIINRCSRETCICGRHFDIKIDKFPCVAKAHVTGNRRWARRQNNKAYCHRTISCPTNSRCTQCEIVQPIAGSLLYFLRVISEFQLLFLTEFHPSSKSYFDCSFLIISEAPKFISEFCEFQNSAPSHNTKDFTPQKFHVPLNSHDFL